MVMGMVGSTERVFKDEGALHAKDQWLRTYVRLKLLEEGHCGWRTEIHIMRGHGRDHAQT